MKKLIALLLAVAFVCASTIGCGGETKSTATQNKGAGTSGGTTSAK